MNKKNVLKSAFVISMFTLLSKVLGFFRETMTASRYGADLETDMFTAATTACIFLIGAFGSGLNTTLVPIFSEVESVGGKKAKLKFLNNVFNIVVFISVILSILAYIFAPFVCKLTAKGFEGETLEYTAYLMRIGIPLIIFLTITYVFSGFLQSCHTFGPYAIMGIPYNLVYLVFLFFFARKGNIDVLMIVSVIAAAVQFLIQIPAVRHKKYRYHFEMNFKDPYIKKTAILILPVIISSSAYQINLMVDKTLASDLVHGSISVLNYSSKIYTMIIAVFIMTLSTIIFPQLSEAMLNSDHMKIKDIIKKSINVVALITIPATVAIIILSYPIVEVLFERNRFDRTATLMTSGALTFYTVGLFFTSMRMILEKVFYSMQKTKIPMINGIISVIINISFDILLVTSMQHRGLAFATSISSIVSVITLYFSLKKIYSGIDIKDNLVNILKIIAASLIMGVIIYIIYYGLGSAVAKSKFMKFIMLTVTLIIGSASYFISASLVKVDSINELKKLRKRK